MIARPASTSASHTAAVNNSFAGCAAIQAATAGTGSARMIADSTLLGCLDSRLQDDPDLGQALRVSQRV